MSARPNQCSCCPQCPDVDPLVCAVDIPPATNEHPAVYNLNETGEQDWNVEKFQTTGVALDWDMSFPLVFTDKSGQRFDPLTAGAIRLDMTATPGAGVQRWIAGLIFWPAATVTPPDILSRTDGPITLMGCVGAKLRWLRGGQTNLGENDSKLFCGAVVRHRGTLYIQPRPAASLGERCWQNFNAYAGHYDEPSPLSGQFRRPLQARDLSDDEMSRLPDWPGGDAHGAIGRRPRDELFRLEPDSDPILVIDERPEDWLEKYTEFGWWIGLSDIQLDQKDGTAPPVNLGKGDGNDRETAASCALDNLCYSVTKRGLYPTVRDIDKTTRPWTYTRDYGRGSVLVVDDPLDTLPVFGNGADEWFTQRYQEDVAPQSEAPASVDAGYLTWTEETPGFDGYRPIVLATPHTIPAGLWNSETCRLVVEWTYREIDRNDRNFIPPDPPPAGNSTYRRQSCGVGIPGLFGAEVVRDQWSNSYAVRVRNTGPTPYWLETGYPVNPPADWDGPYPGQDNGNGGTWTDDGKFWSSRYEARAPVPFDGSRIAVVATKSESSLGYAQDYRVDIRVFVDGWEITFPSLYSYATGQTHSNAPGFIENRITWQFNAERVYLIGEYGGAWQDLKIWRSP